MRWLGRFRRKPASSTLPRDEQQVAAPLEPSSDSSDSSDSSNSSESTKLVEQEVAPALTALLQAPTWDDTFAYLQQHSDLLLSKAALNYLDTVMAARNT